MKNKSLIFYFIMPFFILIFCGAVIFLMLIQPYDRVKTYFRIGFMDNTVTIPEKNGIAGLNIVQTDIDTEYSGDVYEKGKIEIPEFGTQYAVLETADLYVPIYWGSGSELLEMGGCNAPSSALIGAEGNTVISAHVNTFFHDLNKLKAGDTVTLYTNYGKFTYIVKNPIEFAATDKSYVRMTEENILTLYTCEMNLMAESSKRLGFVCSLDKSEFYNPEESSE